MKVRLSAIGLVMSSFIIIPFIDHDRSGGSCFPVATKITHCMIPDGRDVTKRKEIMVFLKVVSSLKD